MNDNSALEGLVGCGWGVNVSQDFSGYWIPGHLCFPLGVCGALWGFVLEYSAVGFYSCVHVDIPRHLLESWEDCICVNLLGVRSDSNPPLHCFGTLEIIKCFRISALYTLPLAFIFCT